MKKINDKYEKVPPQEIGIEMAVLGGLLLEREALHNVSGIIDTHCFYLKSHQTIFETIKAVSKKGPVDLHTVTHELKDLGLLEGIGGPGYLVQLTSQVASAAHIETHARIIAEMYYKRESIRKATELISMSFNGEDVDTLSSQWKQSCDGLEDIFTVADSGSHISQVLKDTLLEIDEDCTKLKDKQSPGIPCGFPSLDRATGGWRDSNLNICASRPGVGKTSFALFFALRAAFAGYWVTFYSWEMGKQDLVRILLAAVGDIYRSKIRDGQLDLEDWKKVNIAAGQLEGLPIIFRDASGMNVEQVAAAIKKNHKHGRCDFAIIDYLQLVKTTKKANIREQEVAEISRALKMTALTVNIPILALAQLNRTSESETPRLSHLRESGAIEQDADNIYFLHHPDPDDKHKIRLTIVKHRRGQLGEIDICSNDQMTRFSENPEKFEGNNN